MTELNQNIDFEIIWKKIHSKTTEAEEILLDQWINYHPNHRRYFDNAVKYYSKGSQLAQSPSELKKALKRIYREANIHTPIQNSRIIGIVSIAASVLFLIYFQFFRVEKAEEIIVTQQAQSIVPGTAKAVLILADGSEHDLTTGENSIIDADGIEIKNTGKALEYSGKSELSAEIKYNTLKIPRGGEYFLVLSDSTKVWLNSETTLRFPVQFAANERRVELTGEAYFEVTKNDKIPFIVTSGSQQVKVLGTEFNVSSYSDNQAIFTTLVNGSVEVSIESLPEKKMFLKPNEQSIVSVNENQIQKKTVDVSSYIAWKDGRFVFNDQQLEEIMNTLSKWYDVQVVFTNQSDKKLRFTGNLERYEDFNNILTKIERTNEVKFEIEKNLITIK
jgi:ferric-dicitrate binding protein FerR (iron transport regulator)